MVGKTWRRRLRHGPRDPPADEPTDIDRPLLGPPCVPLEEISRLVGHKNTTTTELVYRKQIRPVLQGSAVAMDRIFKI